MTPKIKRNTTLGGAGEIRTPDPLRARQVLSQLSYNPKNKLNRYPVKNRAYYLMSWSYSQCID